MYFNQFSWLFRSVTSAQIIDDMLPAIYGLEREEDGIDSEDYSGPHDLALLFMVFAVGALSIPNGAGGMDELEGLLYNQAAPRPIEHTRDALGEHYYQVARGAIALQPILEKPSIVTIQALHLMSMYTAIKAGDTNDTSMELSWSLLKLSADLSMTVCSTITSF